MHINYSITLCLIILAWLPFDNKVQNAGLSDYIRLNPASESSRNDYLEISSDVDSSWR